MNEETAQGNPNSVQDAVLGSGGNDFFEALENDVNGAIQDETQHSEVTPPCQLASQIKVLVQKKVNSIMGSKVISHILIGGTTR